MYPAFREGLVSTRFLAEHEETLRAEVPDVVPLIASALASAPRKSASTASVTSVWDAVGGWGR